MQLVSLSPDCTYPSIYVDTQTDQFVIACQGHLIDCKSTEVVWALYYVLALYYILDIDYPEQHSNILGFAQRAGIGDKSKFASSSKFNQFWAKHVI